MINNTRSLATKYRPQSMSEVVEQDEIKTILSNQLKSKNYKPAYLLTGSQGTGKTTMGRLFGAEINNHRGNIIELDAASNSSVENIREIINQAKTQSIDSEYKIFLIDEVHSLSSQAFQALLKTLEEPPLKAIFILCTTNPEKIPKTILSRVQRYDLKRISQQGIMHRLQYILANEGIVVDESNIDAIDYVSRLADGGMRDAITLLEKCLGYSEQLTIDNVLKALGIADYDTMFTMLNAINDRDVIKALECIDTVYQNGADMKQFIKNFTDMLLDVCKYSLYKNFKYIKIPNTHKTDLDNYTDKDYQTFYKLLDVIVKVNGGMRWETNPRSVLEAELLLFMNRSE